MNRRAVALACGMASIAGLFGGLSLASDVDCLGPEYLGPGAISFEPVLGATPVGIDTAATVALAGEHPFGETLGEVGFGVISDGPPPVTSVRLGYLVVVHHDPTPRLALGTPTGTEGVIVTSPCSVVAVDELGNYLWTHRIDFPVE